MSNAIESDAFVFFGATGDLAYKKIFPALYAMVHKGELTIPIIGIARAGWSLDKLRERARASVQEAGDIEPECFAKMAALMRYVDGDYADPETFEKLKETLGTLPPNPFTIWPSRRACFRASSKASRNRAAPTTPALSSRSLLAATWPAPKP